MPGAPLADPFLPFVSKNQLIVSQPVRLFPLFFTTELLKKIKLVT